MSEGVWGASASGPPGEDAKHSSAYARTFFRISPDDLHAHKAQDPQTRGPWFKGLFFLPAGLLSSHLSPPRVPHFTRSPCSMGISFPGHSRSWPCRGASEPLRVSFGLIPTPGKSWTPELPSIQVHSLRWGSRSGSDAHRVESPRERPAVGRAASCRPPGYSPSPSRRGRQVKMWPG